MINYAAVIIVLIGAASFGFVSTIYKLSYQDGYTPNIILCTQAVLVFLFFLLASIYKRKDFTYISYRVIIIQAIIGVFTALTGIFYTLALTHISASYGIVLLFQFTWMGIFLDTIIRRRRPDKIQILALILILSGTFFAAGIGKDVQELDFIGIVYGLLAALSYTFVLFTNSYSPLDYPVVFKNLFTSAATLVCVYLIFSPENQTDKIPILWGGLTALFGGIIPFICMSSGIPYIGISLASLISSIELPVVLISANFFLNEKISYTMIFGVVLILIGITISIKKDKI